MKRNKLRKYTKPIVLCAMVLVFGAAAPALAQTNDQNQTPVEQPRPVEEPTTSPSENTEATGAMAEYSDQDVMEFVMVAGEMSTIVQDSEKQMIQVIQKENLDIEKFNEIMEARQQPENNQINATAEEITAFNNAAMKVIEIQNSMRENMQQVIISKGMDADKFQQMMLAYQQNPAFQERVNVLLGE